MQTAKRKVLLLLCALALAMACAGTIALYRPSVAAAADPSFTLNGSSHTIVTIDPWEISEGEAEWGVLKINSFRATADGYSGGIVYTTKWLYSHTPVREGAYEYAFEYTGGKYVLSEKNRGRQHLYPRQRAGHFAYGQGEEMGKRAEARRWVKTSFSPIMPAR